MTSGWLLSLLAMTVDMGATDTRVTGANPDKSAEAEVFFTTIWPAEGIYALFTLPDRKHYQFRTIAEAVAKTIELDATPGVQAVYHACASYKGASCIDGSGKPRFRVQENVYKLKTFIADIDCGEKKAAEGKGYITKNEAIKDVNLFLREHGLPLPTMILDSGHGLHLYWALTEAIDAATWTATATMLAALFKAGGLLVDPARTKDSASVLRPVGTTNRKDPDKPKPVVIKYRGGLVSFENFSCAVTAAADKLGIGAPAGAIVTPAQVRTCIDNSDLVSAPEYPPSDADSAANHCAQLQRFRETGCDESEPTWHAAIGVVKHCTKGEELAHDWSRKSDRYDRKETQGKIDNWTTGPTTCNKFRELDPKGCEGCNHTCTSPIQLGVATALPEWLVEMNAQYAWINQESGIYRIRYRDYISVEKFYATHANQTQPVVIGNTTKYISVARLWMTHQNRRQHEAVVTRPGGTPVTADNCLNDWAGFTVMASPGDVEPFKKLYVRLIEDNKLPLLWMAHLVQFPGVKMFMALVLWSIHQGVGKNLLFETIGALFSPHHYSLIGQSDVDDDFCGWIPGTVFVIADEVRASKSEKSRDRLNLWTTATTLRTHDKGQPKRVVDNLMNMVFLSNHSDGMFLSDHDRRFYVHEVKAGPLPEALKQEFLNWRTKDGLSHLLHYLQSIDLNGFDPKGRAPVTESKRDMIEAGRSDLDRWARDVVDGSLPIGKEVATADELTRRFCIEYPNARNQPSGATVAKVLVRMGAYRRPNQVRLSTGVKVRALALVRIDYWKDQADAAWRDELEKRK